jgi:hypothetical protein
MGRRRQPARHPRDGHAATDTPPLRFSCYPLTACLRNSPIVVALLAA